MNDHPQYYKLNPDVVFQPMDDNAIIVSLNSEEIYKLNATGTQIVKLISEEKSIQDIITTLKETYTIENIDLEKEVAELIHELCSASLIEAVRNQ
jgi:hypothetical protein